MNIQLRRTDRFAFSIFSCGDRESIYWPVSFHILMILIIHK